MGSPWPTRLRHGPAVCYDIMYAIVKLPFSIDRAGHVGLSMQMADQLRMAISSGRYAPGETLPTIREWAKMLGVSIRVPTAAIRTLCREGLLEVRPRHGCVVLPRGHVAWRGNVVVVMPEGDNIYIATVMGGRIVRRLEEAGFYVFRASVPVAGDTANAMSRLKLALRQSVSLAILVRNTHEIANSAAKAGVPFLQVEGPRSRAACCIGHVRMSFAGDLGELAQACVAGGVRSLAWVHGNIRPDLDLSKIHAAGVSVREWRVRIDTSKPSPESVHRGGMEKFLRLKRDDMPDALFFTDDYLAQGALTAMLANGIDVPGDVKVATLSNYGLGPVFIRPLARYEIDSFANGDRIAEAAVRYLDMGHRPGNGIVLGAKWITGDTFA